MSLTDWLAAGWVVKHSTTAQEIRDLLAVADRDLADSQIEQLSLDSRLKLAYNAALSASTAALASEGYRASRDSHHLRVIQSLKYTIGANSSLVMQFDAFRKKRNISDYERAGSVSDQEASEIFELAKKIRNLVENWLRKNHSDLMS